MLFGRKNTTTIITEDIIATKQAELVNLQAESASAFDLVTSTINQLMVTNEKIDVTISEIEDAKRQLNSTQKELETTKTRNAKVLEKFKALIEV